MDEGKTDASGLGKMLTGSYIVDKDNDYCKESVLNERGKKLIKNVSNCSDSEVYASRMLEQLPLDYFTKSEMARSLIKWSSYSHIYSSLTPYGYPTCFLPTRSHLVIGTSKGMILIFDFREFLHGILIPQSSTSDADNALRDAVKILKISEDGTHVLVLMSRAMCFYGISTLQDLMDQMIVKLNQSEQSYTLMTILI